MKYIKTFNEVLKPSQFRRYVKAFNRDRYKSIFETLKAKYSGDKNAYRIYIPLIGESNVSATEKEIADFLKQNQIEIINYKAGKCKREGSKNESKIGQLLTRFKREDLLKKFNEDPDRKVGKDNLLVCISRHPYDIAGADTDRAWTNCMSMASFNSKYLETLVARSMKLREDLNKHVSFLSQKELELEELDLDFDDVDPTYYANLKKEIKDYKDKYKVDKLIKEWEDLEKSISDRISSGANARYLMQDVKQGSLAAFLIKETDKNVNDPIANWNIKPFVNSKNENEFLLVKDAKGYGQPNNAFGKTIDAVLEEINGDKMNGIYCLNDKLYNDGRTKVYKLTDDELLNINAEAENMDEVVSNIKLYKQADQFADICDFILGIKTAEIRLSDRYDNYKDKYCKECLEQLEKLLYSYLTSKGVTDDSIDKVVTAYIDYLYRSKKTDITNYFELLFDLIFAAEEKIVGNVNTFINKYIKQVISRNLEKLTDIFYNYVGYVDGGDLNYFQVSVFNDIDLSSLQSETEITKQGKSYELHYSGSSISLKNNSESEILDFANRLGINITTQPHA